MHPFREQTRLIGGSLFCFGHMRASERRGDPSRSPRVVSRYARWSKPTSGYLLIMDLEPMLRCDQCGNQEHNSMQVVKLPRNA